MWVSCGDCTVNGVACAGCAMGSVLGPRPTTAEFDHSELAALDVLAEAGLIPKLRWRPHRAAGDVMNVTVGAHDRGGPTARSAPSLGKGKVNTLTLGEVRVALGNDLLPRATGDTPAPSGSSCSAVLTTAQVSVGASGVVGGG